MYSTVRIETVDSGGNTFYGTGFIFHRQHGDLHCPCIVTNRHVVENMQRGSITFHTATDGKLNVSSCFKAEINNWGAGWSVHPDSSIDIAATPLFPILEHCKRSGVELFYRELSSRMIIPTEKLEELDVIEEVYCAGYPAGLWDEKHYLPIFRRGMTATHPALDFNGKPIFLVDGSVFGGSSGSPVFLIRKGAWVDKHGTASGGGYAATLLGIVARAYFRTQVHGLVEGPIPTSTKNASRSDEMIDLGVVFKAKAIIELVDSFAPLPKA